MNNEKNRYINDIQECNKLVESIKNKTRFIQEGKLSNCAVGGAPSISELDLEIGSLLSNLKDLHSSIVV
jgi:hypothetical protein